MELTGPRYEVAVAEGLETIAAAEIEGQVDGQARLSIGPGLIAVDSQREPAAFRGLRTVQSVAWVEPMAVPRPRALLGDEHLRHLVRLITAVRAAWPAGAFRTLHLAAAGAETTVLRRLRAALAAATGLADDPVAGDLLLRLRRPLAGGAGWEAVIRIAPRPLAVRAWRVCNWPGALNAAIAAAMVTLSQPRADDVVLNVGCGSGTLLIERLLAGPAGRVLGCDTAPAALECARQNLAAAGLTAATGLHDWAATALPLTTASVDTLLADLPFGQLVGSHAVNLSLYPALVAEAARVVRPGGRAVLITQETRLLARARASVPAWQEEQQLPLRLDRTQPTVVVWRRR